MRTRSNQPSPSRLRRLRSTLLACRYLIDADGFIRYQHRGEGTYEENKEEIQELLAERNEILAIWS